MCRHFKITNDPLLWVCGDEPVSDRGPRSIAANQPSGPGSIGEDEREGEERCSRDSMTWGVAADSIAAEVARSSISTEKRRKAQQKGSYNEDNRRPAHTIAFGAARFVHHVAAKPCAPAPNRCSDALMLASSDLLVSSCFEILQGS